MVSTRRAVFALLAVATLISVEAGSNHGIAQETVLADAAVSPLPEGEFFEDLSTPPSKEAKARNEAIGSAADAALKVEAKPIPEIPKDWAKHEAEVKKTSDKATGSAAGRLGKHSRQHVAAVERKFLTADHNGSLDPASPWNQGARETKAAQEKAVRDNKIDRDAKVMEAKDAAQKKLRAQYQKAKKKSNEHAQARQKAWDKTNAEKRNKAAEAAKEKASKKHYDERLRNRRSDLFKNDPKQQEEKEEEDTHHKHMAKPPKSL